MDVYFNAFPIEKGMSPNRIAYHFQLLTTAPGHTCTLVVHHSSNITGLCKLNPYVHACVQDQCTSFGECTLPRFFHDTLSRSGPNAHTFNSIKHSITYVAPYPKQIILPIGDLPKAYIHTYMHLPYIFHFV